MSWSVNAIGKPAAVAAKLAIDFAKNRCVEPEETLKNMVADIVAGALAVYPPNLAVRVEAGGSQHAADASKPTELVNSLKIEIAPVYGFLE